MNTHEVSNEMICSIASMAAQNVDGIEKMFMRLSDELLDAIYPSAVSKGVKVIEHKDGYVIELHVIMSRGVEIAAVAERVQQKVKEAVEVMVDSVVSQVNIYVKGSGVY